MLIGFAKFPSILDEKQPQIFWIVFNISCLVFDSLQDHDGNTTKCVSWKIGSPTRTNRHEAQGNGGLANPKNLEIVLLQYTCSFYRSQRRMLLQTSWPMSPRWRKHWNHLWRRNDALFRCFKGSFVARGPDSQLSRQSTNNCSHHSKKWSNLVRCESFQEFYRSKKIIRPVNKIFNRRSMFIGNISDKLGIFQRKPWQITLFFYKNQ